VPAQPETVVPAHRWLAGPALAILVTGLSLAVWAVLIVPMRFRVPPEISLITLGR